MKIVDSTDGVVYSHKRRSGVTTRVADNVIQQLFSGHKVRLLDFSGTTPSHLERLRAIVLLRLKTEHNIIMGAIDLTEESDCLYINLKYRDG